MLPSAEMFSSLSFREIISHSLGSLKEILFGSGFDRGLLGLRLNLHVTLLMRLCLERRMSPLSRDFTLYPNNLEDVH